jgi:hypothetical protein
MNVAKYMGKRLRENEIGKAYGLSSGKLNPWDLDEFETARQSMLTERDVGLSDLTRRLTQSGVEGPAAALSLEKAGNKYSNSLLDLANKLRGAYTDRGLTLGKQSIDEANSNYWKNIETGLNWRSGHDARRAQPNDFMKTVQGVNAATGALSNIAELGLGGAGMLGMLPGMNGVSSMASGGGMNIMELFKMLQRMIASGPAPSGSTYG